MDTVLLILNVAEKAIFAILILSSIVSIGVMIDRRRAFAANLDPEGFRRAENDLLQSKVAAAGEATGKVGDLIRRLAGVKRDAIEPAYRHWAHQQRSALEKNLPILATLGANAPFVGLLGTVFGIIEAFSTLSGSSGAPNAVMASIAEALLATAVGLFVAIPAVVAYNYYSQRLKAAMGGFESLKNLYLSATER